MNKKLNNHRSISMSNHETTNNINIYLLSGIFNKRYSRYIENRNQLLLKRKIKIFEIILCDCIWMNDIIKAKRKHVIDDWT